MQTGADIIATPVPVDREKATALHETYLLEAERYAKEKEEAKNEAEN